VSKILLKKREGFPEIRGINFIDILKLLDKIEYKKTFMKYIKKTERQCKAF